MALARAGRVHTTGSCDGAAARWHEASRLREGTSDLRREGAGAPRRGGRGAGRHGPQWHTGRHWQRGGAPGGPGRATPGRTGPVVVVVVGGSRWPAAGASVSLTRGGGCTGTGTQAGRVGHWRPARARVDLSATSGVQYQLATGSVRRA
jgi:hypothetical protein